MSIDRLQEKIRKLKNPTVVDMNILPDHIPPHILDSAECFLDAYRRVYKELLVGLKSVVPAVRFSLGAFSLMGSGGMKVLEEVLSFAKQQGYYIFLDGTQILSEQDAMRLSNALLGEGCPWQYDGLVLMSYIGSDGIRPVLSQLKKRDKGLFLVVRTSNKTAPELQDLLTGSRLVHLANADIANRYSDTYIGRSGYSQVALMAAAASADSLRTLRSKYSKLFLLLDGCDYPNANAKNCSYAFDKLGHGAIACAGLSITTAWMEDDGDGLDYVDKAVCAAERLKKNLTRYVTIR